MISSHLISSHVISSHVISSHVWLLPVVWLLRESNRTQGDSSGKVTICEVAQRTASVDLKNKELWQRLRDNLAEMDAIRELTSSFPRS
jgi:predicted Rdx family selenoprotein